MELVLRPLIVLGWAIWLSLAWVLTSDSVVPATKTDAHGLSKEAAEIHSGIPQGDPIPILFNFELDALSTTSRTTLMALLLNSGRQLSQ